MFLSIRCVIVEQVDLRNKIRRAIHRRVCLLCDFETISCLVLQRFAKMEFLLRPFHKIQELDRL